MSNNLVTIKNDVSNYEIPVFQISQKEIDGKNYSRISLDSLKFTNDFKTVNYNNNCIRWIRKVELKKINDVESSNPYFTINPPENEYHLCSLYLTPGNYSTRTEIINQINNELNRVKNTLFNEENQLKNSYLQYNYTGNIEQSISLYNTKLNSGSLIYPTGSKISNIYTDLIELIQLSGKTYNFDNPVLIRYGKYDIYNDLYLILNNSNSNGLNDFQSLWSTFNSYEKTINHLITLQNLNNKYIPIYKPSLTTIYGINEGLYEFRNGFSIYSKLESLDSDQKSLFNSIANIIYNPDLDDSECLLISDEIDISFYRELSYALFNYICNFIFIYKNNLTNSEYKILSLSILQICRKLNIYEIDNEFIENFMNLIDENNWQAGIKGIYKSIGYRWLIRLLNNFIVSILIEKSFYPNNLNNEIIINRITEFNNNLIEKISQLISTSLGQQFDILDPANSSNNSYWNKWIKYPTDIYPSITSKISLIQTIINSYSGDYENTVIQNISQIINSAIDSSNPNSPLSLFNNIIKLNLEPVNSSETNTVCTYNFYIKNNDNLELSHTVNLTESSISVLNSNIQNFNFTIPDAIMETDNSTVLSISANDFTDISKFMEMTGGNISRGSIKYIQYIGENNLNIPCEYELNGNLYSSITLKNGDVLAFQEFIYLSSNMIQLSTASVISSNTNININSKNILENMNRETSIIQNPTLNESITLKTSNLLNDLYFEKINENNNYFELVNSFGNEFLQSNIGKLLFVETDENVINSSNNYAKNVYYGKSNPYLYLRDLYIKNNLKFELTNNPTKLKLYENQNSSIPDQFFKYNQFTNNLISRIGLDHWIIKSSEINLPFIKTSNYTETIFTGDLSPKFNITNLDNRLTLNSKVLFNNILLNQLFDIVSSNITKFISNLSLLKPSRIIVCTSNNKNIEKIINENYNSTNKIYEFNINENDKQFNGKFSTSIRIEVSSDGNTYVFAYAEDQPYSITNGLSELKIQYIE